MKLHKNIDEFEPERPVVVTQGTFDGVHYGHRQILERVVSHAKEVGGESVLLTFYPHPRLVLYPKDNDLKLLNTLDEKMALVEAIGVDHIVVLPFTKEFSRLSPEQFVKQILVDKLKVSKLIIGYDHRFGKNRSGSLTDMERFSKQFGFEIEEIPAQDISESIVSSTKIRRALLEGDVTTASELMGRSYRITGEVVHGEKRGKDIGYPTANVALNSEYKLVPNNGVYAVEVKVDGKVYGGMLNIGDNPTFDDKNWSIEVHIFEFDSNIYNSEIEIAFIKKMRNEMKFDSVQDLMDQMKSDEIHAKTILQ